MVHSSEASAVSSGPIRHDWTREEAARLYRLPFNDLLFEAHSIHRRHFDPNAIQKSELLSIKTGGCQEDCGYCAQSAHHEGGVKASKLMDAGEVVGKARAARERGATRYRMGAAWRSIKARDMEAIDAMIRGVKALGLETCMTLGSLSDGDVARLKDAGLDYYNHNIDTSERRYAQIVTTHGFADRLATLERVQAAGIRVCSGGIVGMEEEAVDRVDMLVTLASLARHPDSVPINLLIPMPGTPLGGAATLDPLEFVRTIALARIMMPKSFVRLSAGRSGMSDALQALCFFAGANSIFSGETLLTAGNAAPDADDALFAKLGLRAMAAEELAANGAAGR